MGENYVNRKAHLKPLHRVVQTGTEHLGEFLRFAFVGFEYRLGVHHQKKSVDGRCRDIFNSFKKRCPLFAVDASSDIFLQFHENGVAGDAPIDAAVGRMNFCSNCRWLGRV